MKKFDFPLFSDMLFYAVAGGFIALCVLRYYAVPLALSLLASILFSLAVGILSYLWVGGKHQKKLLSKQQIQQKEGLMLHLALEKSERVRALLFDAFQREGKEVHLTENGLLVNDIEHVLLFTMQPLSADRVAKLLQTFGTLPFVLVCNDCSPEAKKLLATFDRQIISGAEIYALFIRTDTMPKTMICGNVPKKTMRTKLLQAVKKSNARPMFVSGLLLLLMSLFTLFPLYYLVMGSILVLCAVIVRLFGRSVV